MTITRLKLERFTAFESLEVEFSPRVNIFLGTNGTGKTHLMKVVYAACDVTKSDLGFVEKLVRVFLPSGRGPPGRLGENAMGQSTRCTIEVSRDGRKLSASFSNHTRVPASATVTGIGDGKEGGLRRFTSRSRRCWPMHRDSAPYMLRERFTSRRFTPILWIALFSP